MPTKRPPAYPAHPTRTRSTETRYLKRARHLIDRYTLETGHSWSDDPLALCRWLGELRSPKLAHSTWRQYKASMICFMERHGPTEAVRMLADLDCANCARRGRKRSARRLQPDELAQLLAVLDTRLRWDRLLGLWLTAGSITGLRPAEWRSAAIEGDVLIVNNAKATNGRAHGPTRRLHLANLSDLERRTVEGMLRAMAEEPDFDAAFKGCRQRLWVLAGRLWPRRRLRPSLYSARHQFRADAVSAGRTREEVAAMMGHGSAKTATRHYGYGKWGTGRQGVVPDAGDVARVRPVEDGHGQGESPTVTGERVDE